MPVTSATPNSTHLKLDKPLQTAAMKDTVIKLKRVAMTFFGMQPNTLEGFSSSPRSSKNNGNTPLHDLISNYTDFNTVTKFLMTTDKSSVLAFARTVNDKGQLPVDLVKDLQLDEFNKQKIYDLFFYLYQSSEKKLSDHINFKDITNRYQLAQDSPLYKNLQMACNVVNESRSAIKASLTHPDINEWSEEDAELLAIETTNMRRMMKQANYSLMLTNPWGILFDTINTVSEKRASIALKFQIGLCGELCYVAMHFLKLKDKNTLVRPFSLNNGDHEFIVIGEKENAVVCDVWAGDVYPLNEIPLRMKDYRHVLTRSIFTLYNPAFHSIVPFPIRIYAPFKLSVLLMSTYLLIRAIMALTNNFSESSVSTFQPEF